MLSAIVIVTLVLRTIRPSLNAVAVLFVFHPFTLVMGSVEMTVDTFSVCFVVFPFSLVNVTVCVS
jgi:hypothetical protein